MLKKMPARSKHIDIAKAGTIHLVIATFFRAWRRLPRLVRDQIVLRISGACGRERPSPGQSGCGEAYQASNSKSDWLIP
jgi:hypothetical protein